MQAKVSGTPQRARPFDKMLALWALALCHFSGQDSVAIGSPGLGRPNMAFQQAVGCFSDLLVYLIAVKPNGTPATFLQDVCHTAAEVDANSHVPFSEIQRLASGRADYSRHPVFQAMLTWQPKGGWECFNQQSSLWLGLCSHLGVGP